jgi:hypothetical protein
MPVFLRSFRQHACQAQEGRNTNLEADLAQIAQGSGKVRHGGLRLPVGRGWSLMSSSVVTAKFVRIDLTSLAGRSGKSRTNQRAQFSTGRSSSGPTGFCQDVQGSSSSLARHGQKLHHQKIEGFQWGREFAARFDVSRLCWSGVSRDVLASSERRYPGRALRLHARSAAGLRRHPAQHGKAPRHPTLARWRPSSMSSTG